MTEQRTAWGWGLASIDAAGNTLDVWYPELTLGEAPAETSRPNHNFGAIAHDEADARGVRRMPVFTVSKLDEPIEDAADAYLRLHLLSMRLAKPNTLNLDGIFAKLNNVVWTNLYLLHDQKIIAAKIHTKQQHEHCTYILNIWTVACHTIIFYTKSTSSGCSKCCTHSL